MQDGETALHRAILNGNTDVATVLLAAGAIVTDNMKVSFGDVI